jgi:hypothetical protein
VKFLENFNPQKMKNEKNGNHMFLGSKYFQEKKNGDSLISIFIIKKNPKSRVI